MVRILGVLIEENVQKKGIEGHDIFTYCRMRVSRPGIHWELRIDKVWTKPIVGVRRLLWLHLGMPVVHVCHSVNGCRWRLKMR